MVKWYDACFGNRRFCGGSIPFTGTNISWYGGTGRRSGLKNPCLMACGFKSRYQHQNILITGGDTVYLKCKNCVYHKGTADMDTIESTCKRLDHKHLQFAVPWFRSYDCDGRICADFKPSPFYAYCYRLWHDRYIRFYRPKDERDTIGLVVDKNTSVRYYVKYQDFFDNTFLNEDGGLKWLYKSYYIEPQVFFSKDILFSIKECSFVHAVYFCHCLISNVVCLTNLIYER